tara:strand:+ start:5943 stop:7811 length:1869 start_codon:yes stop_codon:yes gene_type:complete
MASSINGMRPKSENWSVEQLVNLINQKRIRNPKCQRRKKWGKQPIPNSKKSNYHDYIKFLYDTCYSVEAITIAKYIEDKNEIYVNIDGNNRINAIVYFYNHPLDIFRNNFHELRYSGSKHKAFIDMLSNIDYPTFMGIRRMTRYINRLKNEELSIYWKSLEDDMVEYIEDEVEIVQSVLKISGGEFFHTNVFMNLVIFNNPSTDQLSQIFSNINMNSNPLSSNDILAATLLCANDFNLDFNPGLKTDLYKQLNQYYNERQEDEILECYRPDSSVEKMNGTEFLISFQNYCSEKYQLIPNFDSDTTDGIGVFHKLFDLTNIFYGLQPNHFTTENIQHFSESIIKSLEVLSSIVNKICPPTIDLYHFKQDSQLTLKKTPLIVLIVTTIKLLELMSDNKISEKEVHAILKRTICYHYLLDYLPKDKRDKYIVNDDIRCQAGGKAIQTKVNSITQKPEQVSQTITTTRMTSLFKDIVDYYNQPYKCEDRPKRRRGLSFPYRLLLSLYYNNRVPYVYTQKKQNIDHVFVFSSNWENDNKIDLDRIGNLILIDGDLNNKRSNNSIQYYYDSVPDLMNCLNYPNIESYNSVVTHDKKSVTIYDTEQFKKITNNIENMYIENAVKCIFDV